MEGKPMAGILIDAEHRRFRQIECRPGEISKHTGGSISLALTYPRPDPPKSMFWYDIVYCDDEGLMKNYQYFFRSRTRRRDSQPIAGNGVLTGPDIVDEKGDYLGSADPFISLSELAADIEWMDRAQFVAWVKERRDEASITVNGVPYAYWREYLEPHEKDWADD